jgi:hypothetical protein
MFPRLVWMWVGDGGRDEQYSRSDVRLSGVWRLVGEGGGMNSSSNVPALGSGCGWEKKIAMSSRSDVPSLGSGGGWERR